MISFDIDMISGCQRRQRKITVASWYVVAVVAATETRHDESTGLSFTELHGVATVCMGVWMFGGGGVR